jgi:hypothetical protein
MSGIAALVALADRIQAEAREHAAAAAMWQERPHAGVVSPYTGQRHGMTDPAVAPRRTDE